MRAFLAACAGLAILAGCASEVETGKASYENLCADCHGVTGRGDGMLANSLPRPPADLTLIAARTGGVFPRNAVMSQIDGYTRDDSHYGGMPAFWTLHDGPTVLVDTGDGILTPTPEALVALAVYLESIQR